MHVQSRETSQRWAAPIEKLAAEYSGPQWPPGRSRWLAGGEPDPVPPHSGRALLLPGALADP